MNESNKAYAELFIDECFTLDEANIFSDYLKRVHNEKSNIVEVEFPIQENILPTGAIPVGGGQDFLMLSREQVYDLPFSVWGYYDIRRSGFTKRAQLKKNNLSHGTANRWQQIADVPKLDAEFGGTV